MPDPPAHGPGRAPSSSWELEQLAMRKLEREHPDPIFQKRLLNRVGASLHFIEHPDPPDPDSVLTLAYDAIRHYVNVHLNINGLRVPNMAGAHRLYVEYTKEKMAEMIGEEDLRHYSAFRQLRNTSEYPTRSFRVDHRRSCPGGGKGGQALLRSRLDGGSWHRAVVVTGQPHSLIRARAGRPIRRGPRRPHR